MRVPGIVAFVLLLALGAGASTASAAPLSMTFTEARADVGVQLSAAEDEDALFKPPATAPFEAELDPQSGLITDGVLTVPDFSTFVEDDPVDAWVTVEFEIGEITGSFDRATGALTLSGTAGGRLTADGRECIVSTSPAPLTLSSSGSTGGASPLSGESFAAGLTGPGAIAGEWTDMTAVPVTPADETVCDTVAERIGGEGGIWMVQEGEIVPPPVPQPIGPDPASPGPGLALPPPPPPCTVPKLAGKTLAGAKKALRAAGCKVGTVGKPKPRKGKKRPALVVRSSSPRPGATPANGKVHLKLGTKPKKRR